MHAANQGLIPGNPYSLLSLPGIISDSRTNINLWAPSGVAPQNSMVTISIDNRYEGQEDLFMTGPQIVGGYS